MRLFLCLALVPLLVTSKVDDDQSEDKLDQVKESKKATHSAKDAHIDQNKLYLALFERKRREHQAALHSIEGIDELKQRPFVEEIIRNIRAILSECRDTLERVRYVPERGRLPTTETERDTLSKAFENTAFFADLALRFPTYVRPKMRDVKLKTAIVWAIQTTKKAELVDETTMHVIGLMEQEMELAPRQADYANPYGEQKSKEEIQREAIEEMKRRTMEKKNKKHDLKIKKGPSMSKSEL